MCLLRDLTWAQLVQPDAPPEPFPHPAAVAGTPCFPGSQEELPACVRSVNPGKLLAAGIVLPDLSDCLLRNMSLAHPSPSMSDHLWH